MRRLILLTLLLPAAAYAAVQPADIFNHNMVLQRGVRVPVWGTADVGERITVFFKDQKVSTTTGAEGRWRVTLEPQRITGPAESLVIRGEQSITFTNVVIGEVWYASGQSNMGMTVQSMAKGLGEAGQQIIDEATLPGIRYARINEKIAANPQDRLSKPAVWTPCSPGSVRSFSAVAYLFAEQLIRRLNENKYAPNVPIGIIDASWGGKPIESFIPKSAFTGHPVLEQIAALAEKNDLAGLKAMTGGTFARDAAWLPGAIYNSRTAPIAPFALRGFLWYQGESNSGVDEDPRHYSDKMRALVRGWRAAWGDTTKLPFYYVQLPGFKPEATGWTYLREEQRKALDIPNSEMVVTIDIESPGIHPANKVDVGQRLARIALSRDYGGSQVYSGPLYARHAIQGAEVTVYFDFATNRLQAGSKDGLNPPRYAKTPPAGFELAGADGRWHPAEARIAKNTVVVTSAQVPEPIAVRYACAGLPTGPFLYNEAGLPASPFCSKAEFMVWKSSSR